MSNAVIKRSVVIAGHKTSVAMEDAFWNELKAIAARRRLTVAETIGLVDANRTGTNLSSAIRLFVLDEVKRAGVLPVAAE
jgi:predicted DNA-binding ribbon-helix-helix protein